ncbi:hypothetical protein AVEN_156626-1, partial [Araneus ventricosus]
MIEANFFPITPKGCGGLVTEYRDQRVMISKPYSTNDQLGSNVLRLARCGNSEKDSTKDQLGSNVLRLARCGNFEKDSTKN